MDFWCVKKWNDEIYFRFYFCHITPLVLKCFWCRFFFSSIWMDERSGKKEFVYPKSIKTCEKDEMNPNKNRNKALWSTCKTFTKWILSISLNWFSLLSYSVVFCFIFLFLSILSWWWIRSWLLFMLIRTVEVEGRLPTETCMA